MAPCFQRIASAIGNYVVESPFGISQTAERPKKPASLTQISQSW